MKLILSIAESGNMSTAGHLVAGGFAYRGSNGTAHSDSSLSVLEFLFVVLSYR